MNLLKILFLLPLSMLSLKTIAQIDDLLRNKDITWIGESYYDFVTDESFEAEISSEHPNNVTHLKFFNSQDKYVEEKFALLEWLYAAIESKKLPIFEDDACKKRTVPSAWSADSITQIDPVTFEAKIIVVANKPPFKLIPLFRAKQIVFYNAKKAQFGVRTLAIAPIFVYRDYDETTKGFMQKRQPLFWFKVTDLQKKRRLGNKHITWARQINFSNGIPLDSIKVLKDISKTTPMDDLLTTFETQPRIPFYKKNGLYPSQKMSFEDRKKQLWNTDTIQQIDPVTYENKYKVINDRLQSLDFAHLELLQNWYWDNKKKRLAVYLIATAPLKDIRSEGDYELMYRLPLFYRRTDD